MTASATDLSAALTLTPHQAFEVARVLDRTGDGALALVDGRVLLLVDRAGGGRADMALEFDPAGQITGRWLLHRRDREEDDESEQPIDSAEILALREGALLAEVCTCAEPLTNDDADACLRCGHQTAAGHVDLAPRALAGVWSRGNEKRAPAASTTPRTP